MVINDPNLTAREAAAQFARTNWTDSPREVGQLETRDGILWFKLKDGVRTYRVVPNGSLGWEIVVSEVSL